MNLWQCDERCKVTATGIGSPVGLRALGWEVTFNPLPGHQVEILCPAHARRPLLSVEQAQGWQWLIARMPCQPYEGPYSR